MGNTSSHIHHPSKSGATANRPSPPHHPRLGRKLSCITAWSSQESLHSGSSFTSDTSFSEKGASAIQRSLIWPEDHSTVTSSELKEAFDSFVDVYPEYRQTWILDSLRRSDYTRLTRTDETYVDYMGGCLFPESLVQIHADFLSRNIMGNTHSVSNRSVSMFQIVIDIEPSTDCAFVQFSDVNQPRSRGTGRGSQLLQGTSWLYCE